MSDSIRIPDIIRGQVLKQQGGSYYVRGQYVVGVSRNGSAFWYDHYDRRNEGHNLLNLQHALDHLAAFIRARGQVKRGGRMERILRQTGRVERIQGGEVMKTYVIQDTLNGQVNLESCTPRGVDDGGLDRPSPDAPSVQGEADSAPRGTYNCPICGWNKPHAEHADQLYERIRSLTMAGNDLLKRLRLLRGQHSGTRAIDAEIDILTQRWTEATALAQRVEQLTAALRWSVNLAHDGRQRGR